MPDIEDDDEDRTVPGAPRPEEQEEREIEWPDEAADGREAFGEIPGVLEENQMEAENPRPETQPVNPVGGLITLAILALLISFAICASTEGLIWQLAALTIMVAVPAAGAVIYLAANAGEKKTGDAKTPKPAPKVT